MVRAVRSSSGWKRNSLSAVGLQEGPVNGFNHPVPDFYRQIGFEIAQKPINRGIARARNGRAGQFIGVFAASQVDCVRLILCSRGFQQYAIAQTPRVVAYRLPKFVRALPFSLTAPNLWLRA